MPKINVYVPDDLHAQLKKDYMGQQIPVSAVCQRALAAEVATWQRIEALRDIKVILRPVDQNDYDPGNREMQDRDGQAVLIHNPADRRYRNSGGMWSLWWDPNNDGNPQDYEWPGPAEWAADVEDAVKKARKTIERFADLENE